MAHPTKNYHDAFDKKWRNYLQPLKKAIKHELDRGSTPRHAVETVFKRFKLKEVLRKLIIQSVGQAIRDGNKI